jgi:hypothetical protein
MMKHQPFEKWLFMQEALSKDEARSLQEHLVSCERCAAVAAALRAVENRLTTAATLSPEPGFTNRWRTRLARRRRIARQKENTSTIATLSVGLIMLLLVVGARLLPLLQLVAPQYIAWFENVSDVAAHLSLAAEVLLTLIGSAFASIPLGLRIAVPAVLFIMFTLWFTSIYRLGILPVRRRL